MTDGLFPHRNRSSVSSTLLWCECIPVRASNSRGARVPCGRREHINLNCKHGRVEVLLQPSGFSLLLMGVVLGMCGDVVRHVGHNPSARTPFDSLAFLPYTR